MLIIYNLILIFAFEDFPVDVSVVHAAFSGTEKICTKRNVLGRLLLLSQVNDIDLEKVFEYQLGPVP